MWFQVGETYDIDHDLAMQLIALGDAEALNEIKENEPATGDAEAVKEVKENEPATVKKVERQADKRTKK